MIEKICGYILKKMKAKMPEMTDEKAEIIQYGLEILFGEVPKIILLFGISFLLNRR